MSSKIITKTNFIEYLENRVIAQPDQPAFIFLGDGEHEKTRLTYAELAAQARIIAAHLQECAQVGDRILLCYSPGLEFVVAFLACLYAGMIAVPTYPLRSNHHAKRILAIIEDCQPHLVLGTQDSLAQMQQEAEFSAFHYLLTETLINSAPNDYKPVIITPDKLAFLQYTSGSTGTPKGVMVSHGNLLANEQAIHDIFQLNTHDKIISWLPMQHDMGLIGQLLYSIYCGTTEVLMSPTSFLEKPIRWLNAISHYQGYACGGANFGFQLCVDKIAADQLTHLDLSNWKAAFNGSEPIRASTLQQFAQKFAPCGFSLDAFLPCYGMAETTLLVSGVGKKSAPKITPVNKTQLAAGIFSVDGGSEHCLVSSGNIHNSYQVKIVNPSTQAQASPGMIGEIWVSGPSVAQGYWNKSELSAQTFAARLPQDSHHYLRTGDLGYIDGDELYITGRLKDLIILQGRNIYPQDIEIAVEACHPAIRSGCSAAFTVEVNEQEQLVVVAEVERTYRKADFQPVFSAIRQAILQAVDAIPYSIQLLQPAKALRTTSGKIQRRATQAAYLAGELAILAHDELYAPASTTDQVMTRAQVEETIATLLAKVLGVEKVDPQQPFTLLGGTSLEAVIFQQQLQTFVGERLTLSPTIAFDYPTVAELAVYLYSSLYPQTDTLAEETIAIKQDAFNSEPLAIIGMSCRFPGANNPQDFWQLLQSGEESISIIPEQRWNQDFADKNTIQHAGLINDINLFDAAFFNISPREAEMLDPQQRLLLETSWHALENAGINPESLHGSDTGVFIGATTHDYADLLLQEHAHDSYLATGNTLSVLSGRLSYTLGLQGPCLTIDTACSSSLVAIHAACDSLQKGDANLAIVGAVNALLAPDGFINLSKANMLASDGHCKVFAESADGYVRGEGCGVVIIKRLTDAQRDNDTILGIIKSVVINQDGASSGLTVPNGVAQEKLLRRGLAAAQLQARDIDYIEVHGTGTHLGDPMETHAISTVYKESHSAQQPLIIGSVKAAIGHLEAAAGMAGLIKALLLLQHQTIPPQPPIDKINPKINLHAIPGEIATQLQPLAKNNQPSHVAVSSFGFSGTNAHMIIQAPPLKIHTNSAKELEPSHYICPFSAKNAAGLQAQLINYKNYLESAAMMGITIQDLSYTLQIGRQHFAYRRAFVVQTISELLLQLEEAINSPIKSLVKQQVAFLFSDNGKSLVDIQPLLKSSPVFAQAIIECQAKFKSVLPENLPDILTTGSDLDALYAGMHIFCVQYALGALWRSWGIAAQMVCGTGVGIYAAWATAGVLSLSAAANLVIAHARANASLPVYNRALVIFAPHLSITQLLAAAEFSSLFISEIHGPLEIVVSGPSDDLQKLLDHCQEHTYHVQWLSTTARDYRRIDTQALASFQQVAEKISYALPQMGLLDSLSGNLITKPSAKELCSALAQPILHYQTFTTLAEQGTGVFLEIGNDAWMVDWGARYLSNAHLCWISSLAHNKVIEDALLHALAQFYTCGYAINWQAFAAPYVSFRHKLSLPVYPFQRQRYWAKVLDHVIPKKNQVLAADIFYQVAWEKEILFLSAENDNEQPEISAIKWWFIVPELNDSVIVAIEEQLGLSSTDYCVSIIGKSLTEVQVGNLDLSIITHVAYIAPFFIQNVDIQPSSQICLPLLQLIQHLNTLEKKFYLWVFTQRAYAVDNSAILLAHTPLNGFIKTARLESLNLQLRQIDTDSATLAEVMTRLHSENFKTQQELVAYRGQQRYVASLAQADLPIPLPAIKFDKDAYYLITGGLGGLGFSLVSWLISQGVAHIVIVARHSPDAKQSLQMTQWQEDGIEIALEPVDITQWEQVSALMLRYKHGVYPLKGIFHLAGTLEDTPLAKQTSDHFNHVFAAKALGAWYLHQALQEYAILVHHFVLFSSIASLNGSPAQANYAAANAFLDGLAYYRRQQHVAAISINWGPWAEIGMAKELSALYAQLGLTSLSPQQVWQDFALALSANKVQIGIIKANWRQVSQAYPQTQTWLAALTLTDVTDKEVQQADGIASQLVALTRNEQEKLLYTIIADNLKQILNLPHDHVIDVDDSFFTLGLDSLMGLQLINRLRETIGTQVNIKYELVLQKNTIHQLTDYLLAQLLPTLSGNITQKETIKKIDRNSMLPVSFSQERLWFLHQLDPQNRAYSEIAVLKITGELDKAKVENAYQQLIVRHESLRTRFAQDQDESAVQIIESTIEWHLDYQDLSTSAESYQHKQVQQLLTAETLKPFDLYRGPLFRALLIKLSDNQWVLSVTLHHIIADGWSVGILAQEFAVTYNALANGIPFPLPPLTIQYADYAYWQRQFMTDARLADQLRYWQEQLADSSLLNLPLDFPRPTILDAAGQQYPLVISQALTEKLKYLCQQQDVSLYMLLLATLYILLSRYSGQADICIGSPIANRTRPEIESVIGIFVNMIVLRIKCNKALLFTDLLKEVKAICYAAYAHQDVPFEKVVDAVLKDRNMSHTALFDVMLVLQNAPLEPIKLQGLNFELSPFDTKLAKFDLTFELLEMNGALVGQIEYRTRLFKPATIAHIAKNFINLLTAIADAPTQNIVNIDFLSSKERKQLLVDWNKTNAPYFANKTIAQIFAEQVQKTPEHIAVTFEDKVLTYHELNCKANQLARYLCTQGVGVEVLVGICIERSLEMIVGVLGVLKAGGAYVPIDPNYPIERIHYMLADAHIKLCLTQKSLAKSVSTAEVQAVCLDDKTLFSNNQHVDNIIANCHPLNAAYVIYTSGSTGKPKGVTINHRSLINFMQWIEDFLGFVQPMRFLHKTSFGFDVAVSDIFTPILRGGTLIMAAPGEQLEPKKLLARIQKHEVTCIELIPSQLMTIAEEPAFNNNLSLQAMCTGGEALTLPVVERFYEHCHLPLLNSYGPTECTISATASTIKSVEDRITIGRPINNLQIYILDPYINPVPLGASGELCIAGVGLARGYFNRPDLTAEKFLPNPFGEPGSRLYRTGDLVRYLADGQIEYLGRVDHQIKIRGFRIELGEIESALDQHPLIQQALVVAKEQNQSQNLIAYVVLKNTSDITRAEQQSIPDAEGQRTLLDSKELRDFLAKDLPYYMIPAQFVFLSAFPLNSTGKVDRKALPEPEQLLNLNVYHPPRNETEKVVVDIFAHVLGVEKVGIDDNFFELGGHSLLAVRVINALRKELHNDTLPLSILFQTSTARQIAEKIISENNEMSDVLCLQSKGTGRPLFLVPGSDGYALTFAQLARALGNLRPIYGFQFPGLFKDIAFTSIESLAAHYVQAMRTLQPVGPYLIAGWSMGGVVAYEMAKQLIALQEEVEFLGIIDMEPVAIKHTAINLTQFVASLLADTRFGVLPAALPEILSTIPQVPETELLDFAYTHLVQADSLLIKEGRAQFDRMLRIFMENNQLLTTYSLSDKVPHITYFPAKEAYRFDKEVLIPSAMQTAKAWQRYSDRSVTVYRMEGNHFSLLQMPTVSSLAKKINKALATKIVIAM